MRTPDLVALILALTVPVFVFAALIGRIYGVIPTGEAIGGWSELFSALVGGLIGYIGANASADKDKPE